MIGQYRLYLTVRSKKSDYFTNVNLELASFSHVISACAKKGILAALLWSAHETRKHRQGTWLVALVFKMNIGYAQNGYHLY